MRLLCRILPVFIVLMMSSTGARAAGDSYYRIDLLVLMDSSKSMQQSDPDKLRYQGFRDVLSLLETGDRIGLLQFGSTVKPVIPLTEIKDDDSREKMVNTPIPEENLLYTDVKAALTRGYEDINKAADISRLPFLILFSDGEIDPSPEYKKVKSYRVQYLRDLKALSQKYGTRKWPVFAINLNRSGLAGDPAIKAFCEQSGGYMVAIKSPQDIQKTFSDILKSIRKQKTAQEEKIQKEMGGNAEIKLVAAGPEPGIWILGSNMQFRSEIMLNGRKVVPAKEPGLKIAEILSVVTVADGQSARVELKDDGTVENGDLKQDDGIYCGLFTPLHEGSFTVAYYLQGSYYGHSFSDKTEIRGLDVKQAGTVKINAPKREFRITTGSRLKIEFGAVVDSYRNERIELTLADNSTIRMEPRTFWLPGGKETPLIMDMQVSREVVVGDKGTVKIRVASMNEGTRVIGDPLQIRYEIVPDRTLLMAFCILAVIAVMVGLVLIRRKAVTKIHQRKLWIKGELTVLEDGEKGLSVNIDLGRYKTDRIRIGNRGDPQADIRVDTEEVVAIILHGKEEAGKVFYLAEGGLGSILYEDDVPHKTVQLLHNARFQAGSLTFCYTNPKMMRKDLGGVNVLEKYESEMR